MTAGPRYALRRTEVSCAGNRSLCQHALRQQMRGQLAPQSLHFVVRPGAKALAGLKSQPARGYLRFEVWTRAVRAVQFRNDRSVNIERQIETYQVSVLQRTQNCQTQTKTVLHAGIERGGIANTCGNHGDGLDRKSTRLNSSH